MSLHIGIAQVKSILIIFYGEEKDLKLLFHKLRMYLLSFMVKRGLNLHTQVLQLCEIKGMVVWIANILIQLVIRLILLVLY